jgi:hypothetical protein
MKSNRIEEGRFTEHGRGIGTVTEKMVRDRAGEIAIVNGRSKRDVLQADMEQAYRELTGEERLNPTPTAAENITEEDRWPEVPTSAGGKVETEPAPDEQTFAEKLVEEGVEDAEFDQGVEATREELRREKQS